MDPNEMADCRALILGNISYGELIRERPWDRGQVDELVEPYGGSGLLQAGDHPGGGQ